MGSSKNALNTTLRKMDCLDKMIVFNVLIILMLLLVFVVIFHVKSWDGPFSGGYFWTYSNSSSNDSERIEAYAVCKIEYHGEKSTNNAQTRNANFECRKKSMEMTRVLAQEFRSPPSVSREIGSLL
jgi:hypothetical protein